MPEEVQIQALYRRKGHQSLSLDSVWDMQGKDWHCCPCHISNLYSKTLTILDLPVQIVLHNSTLLWVLSKAILNEIKSAVT